MTHRPWLTAYPQGVPADIDTTQYSALVALMDEAFNIALMLDESFLD